MSERYFNNFQTSVASGGYTAGSGVLNVVSTSGITLNSGDTARMSVFNAAGGLVVILVASAVNSGTQFAVTAEGSDANASAGYVVQNTLTAGAMNTIRTNIHGVGAYTDLPAYPSAGDTYIAYDSIHDLFYYNGTNWDAYIGGLKCTAVNTSMFPTAVNAAGASTIVFTNTTSGVLLSAYKTSGGDNVVGRFQAYPTPPFTLRMRFWVNSYSGNYQWMGLAIRNSSTSQLQTFGLENENNNQIRLAGWNSETDYNGDQNTAIYWMPSCALGRHGLIELWLNDDGTYRTYRVCTDGQNPINYLQLSNTEFLTPNEIGIFIIPYSSSIPLQITVVDWTVTT